MVGALTASRAPTPRGPGSGIPIPRRPGAATPGPRGRLLTAALGVLLLLVACDGTEAPPALTPSPSPAASGIRGVVQLSPTCRDAIAAATPCVEPYAARLVIVDGDGNKVTEVRSGEDGRFEVVLPPGEYLIVPAPGGDPFPNGQPVAATVVPGEYTDVVIDYDSGLT